MSVQVVVHVDEGGRLLAVKHGDATALQREADVLAAARHPGVVDLIRVGVDAQGEVVLETASVGPHSLATAPRLPLDRIAGLAAATATILADLHGLGLVHGRLDPSHILVGPAGRPVLCGFSGAGRTGEARPASRAVAAEFTDPAAGPDSPLSPTDDVYALGAVVRWLLADIGPEIEPIPQHRLRRASWWWSWSGWARRALLNLADHATADDPRLRPSAASLARSILQAVPKAALGAGVDPAPAAEAALPSTSAAVTEGLGPMGPEVPGGRDRRPRRHLGPVLTGAAGVLLLMSALSILHRDPSGPHRRRSTAAGTTSAPSTSTTTAIAATSSALAGGVVEQGGLRFEVGTSGDRVVVADWDCDGRATVAMLRAATGEVFVFDGWATSEGDLTAKATATIAGGVDLAADDTDGDGCPALVVVDRDGRRIEVTP